jgi:hypothetical protein
MMVLEYLDDDPAETTSQKTLAHAEHIV